MKIEYTTTLEDIVDFNTYVLYRWQYLKYQLLFSGILLMVSLIPFFLVGDALSLIGPAVVTLMILGIYFGIQFPRVTAIIYDSVLLLLFALILLSSIDIYGAISLLPWIFPVAIGGSWGLIWKGIMKYLYSGKNGMIGFRELTINEGGIHEKMATNESQHSWELVGNIEQNEKYIFIFLGRMKAHVVPKSSFAIPGEADAFFKKVNELKQAAGRE